MLMADPHIRASEGRMVHAEWNPANENLAFQRPEVSVWKSPYVVPTLTDRAHIASNFLADYPTIFDTLSTDNKANEIFQEAGEYLAQGKNVAAITPHKDVIDIGVALLAGKDAIELNQVRARKTGIILSKMLSGVAYVAELKNDDGIVVSNEPVQVVQALSLLCDTIYMTWPRTESAKVHTARLPQEEVDNNNQRAKKALEENLDEGGEFLGLASTGTTHASRTQGGYIKLPGLSQGTIDIMQRPDTVLLPMLVSFDPNNPGIKVPSGLANPTTKDGVLAFMADLELSLNS